MPIIEFECSQGHRTEQLFFTNVEADGTKSVICSVCVTLNRRRRANRVISAPAVQFKGEGWTPTFHAQQQSQIGGVPVKAGDDPREVAKKIAQGSNLVKAVKGAK